MAVQNYSASNQVAPIATGFTRDDSQSDPFVRELYFGGPDRWLQTIFRFPKECSTSRYGNYWRAKRINKSS